MQNTEQINLPRSKNGATQPTLVEDSQEQSMITSVEKLPAKDLIISSIERLRALDKAMYANDPDNSIMTANTEKVRVSIEIHREIRNTLKLGLDIAREMKAK